MHKNDSDLNSSAFNNYYEEIYAEEILFLEYDCFFNPWLNLTYALPTDMMNRC